MKPADLVILIREYIASMANNYEMKEKNIHISVLSNFADWIEEEDVGANKAERYKE